MAFKLSDLIPIRAITGGIEVICEANTSHMSKAYFIVEAHGSYVSAQEGRAATEAAPNERPPLLMLRICPTCMVEYMGYMNGRIQELANLTTRR